MKTTLRRNTLLILVLILVGCTQYRIQQVDESGTGRKITFRVNASSWFSSQQTIQNLKALQTDKTQSFGVDSSAQKGPTNTVEAIKAMKDLVEALN